MSTPAGRLKHARKLRGFNQIELAQKANVATGTIGNIESGKRGIKASAIALARALRVRPEWLADGEEPMELMEHNTIDVDAVDVTNRRALPGATAQAEAPSPTGHLSALVAVFAAAPESTRDTVAMLAAGAIKNPATLADCVHAIEALAKYSAAKSGPPTESKQFQPPTPNAVTHHHAIEPDTHHPGA